MSYTQQGPCFLKPKKETWKTYPVVRIEKNEFEAIKRAGMTFGERIAMVRSRMTLEGLDYSKAFRSWFDQDGNLCHQNFVRSAEEAA
jgi:hypothetical protein